MKKIKLILKKIIFAIKIYIYKAKIDILSEKYPFLSYQLLLEMTFNTDKWFENYLNGQSILSQIEFFINTQANKIETSLQSAIRKANRNPSPEVMARYLGYLQYCELKQQLREYYPDYFDEKDNLLKSKLPK